ncbi:hypothetical protein [Cognataquiflexum rubidum]|uniref:hypothetical protein n=1 Tax=Cognataquiflexum rubidum TaxID=2922273 RepID=UPI001F1481F5|nr:hypothetical protein [Cognataquiflexum rubidum]MCH6236115.1 hypothetical protein [Cognataquiflexum rubidum]
MINFVELDKKNNGNYLKLLGAVSKLSGLFSESSIPFINYRVAENIFCKSFDAINLSRSDTSFDANFQSIGIGLKTFTCPSSSSTEKIAEFNSLSKTLNILKGEDLVIQLSEYRNDRIDLGLRVYDINSSLYHIVARRNKELILFETEYEKIKIDKISNIKQTTAGLSFDDGQNFYTFNFSKSTLFRKFQIPKNAFHFPIDIIEDPYTILLELLDGKQPSLATDKLVRGVNYIVLPLYGVKEKKKFVFEKSGLNQWNAGGRTRDSGEVYIPIPIEIHKYFPNFFPERNTSFDLKIPTGNIFKAKVCQDNGKALMTDPNKALSDWLLRKVLKLKEGELATIEKLDELGFDSVIIIKDDKNKYRIDITKTGAFEKFSNLNQ